MKIAVKRKTHPGERAENNCEKMHDKRFYKIVQQCFYNIRYGATVYVI